MKITIENTPRIVKANGIDCRVWEGKTDSGIEVDVEAFPARMIL